jgi:hypothetical protein
VRRLLDAIAPEAAKPLADLTTDYFARPIDGFFRGTARLLADATSDELATVRELLGRLRADVDADEKEEVSFLYGTIGGIGTEAVPRLRYLRPHERGGEFWEDRGDLDMRHTPHVRRVFLLLKLNGLGEDRTIGENDMVLPRRSFQRLAEYLCD